MLNTLKDVFTVTMARALIAKIKRALNELPPGTAVKGDAETEYRTGNVNLTPANIGAYSKTESDARYKAVQTAVSDPTASGTGLDFIDSVSQNANGEITPHKKTVQDGTTSQKGVVQLNNAIDSTSTTEAATPKAVKDAYDELNSKIVARAVFLSQEEWTEQSQEQGDPAKVYYVENGTGEDAYTVYVWKASTSEYVEVDESSIDLEGYWHDGPNTTGNGNVVTGISLGNDGVPVVEKGITALTQHQSVTDSDPTLAWGARSKVGSVGSTDLHVTMPSNPASGKLDTTGDASDTTSIFTKAIDDTSSMASGGKLSVIFTAISSFFASLKSLAFKDKASYSDLLSGVQYSLDKADSALQPSGNGSNLSVTPDGTSTGTDIGSSTTLMAWAQKFKNLVASLGTAAFKNVPSSGNASTSEVVMGNDSRLTDARTPTSHTHDDRYYTENEVNTLLNNKLNTNGDASSATVTRDGTTTGVNIPSSALALSAFAQKVRNISDSLNTSVLYGYCSTAASSMAKRVNVYNSNVIRLSDYKLVCIHFQYGNTYNDATTDIVFNFYMDDTLWFTKSTRATGWLNHIVAGDYLFVIGPGETEMGFIKSYTQETINAENAKNYIAGGSIASELASLASSIASKQNALPTSGGAYAIDITGNAATAGSCANASNAGYASTAGRTTSAYSWLDYIGSGGRKCFEAFKLDTLGVGNYIQGVVTIFVRTSGNAFKSYNVSFVCYRESGSTYSGKINKQEIANTDSSISVDVYLVVQASIGRVSVVAVVIYTASSGGRYVAGYASGTCIHDGAVVAGNVGATVGDVVPNMTLVDAI